MAITIASNGATLLDAKNPRWGDAEKTCIEIQAKWSHYESIGMTENSGYYWFAARPDDPEPHGIELLEEAKKGTYGTVGDYDPERTT